MHILQCMGHLKFLNALDARADPGGEKGGEGGGGAIDLRTRPFL